MTDEGGGPRQLVHIKDEARLVSAKGAGRNGSPEESRARSPLVCQCSCHERDGRRRSPMRGGYGRYDSGDSRPNSRDRDDKMPPINIRDEGAYKSGKGAGADKYQMRPDGSGASNLSITKADRTPRSSGYRGGKKNRNKPPFRYFGRSKSADSKNLDRISMGGGARNEYDYAHEDFLTGPYTSEYKARYEMRMGQRYTVNQEDRSIHFIDPAGEHVLIPKNRSGPQRSNSEPDIPRNSRNVRLEPIDKSKSAGDKGGEAPDRKWIPNAVPGNGLAADAGKKQSSSLPPLEKTPAIPSQEQSGRGYVPHPLGLNTPPYGGRSRLQPL